MMMPRGLSLTLFHVLLADGITCKGYLVGRWPLQSSSLRLTTTKPAFLLASSSSSSSTTLDVDHHEVQRGGGNNSKDDQDEDVEEEILRQQQPPIINNHHHTYNNSNYNYGLSDVEFKEWVQSELFQDPLYEQYKSIFERAATAITKWRQRYRGNPTLWRRLFKKDRVFKEFVEAAPIINTVVNLIEEEEQNEENEQQNYNYTIIDLASGKGYLSMFLSEMLPPNKVDGLVLMDKAWPMHNQPLQHHHISWEHIYGGGGGVSGSGSSSSSAAGTTTTTTTTTNYQDTWPIPLVTSKQDLKQKCTHRSLQKRFFNRAKGPIILLAVHLCGTLSLRAVDMFNENPNSITFLALKPCCLPPMVHAQRDEVFELGGPYNKHTFAAKLVCSNGKFNGKRWYGPPRHHLINRFQFWAENLFLGVDTGASEDEDNDNENDKGHQVAQGGGGGGKARVKVTVQHDGGYQNAFIFAQRRPISKAVWKDLEPMKVSSFLEQPQPQQQYGTTKGKEDKN